MLCMIYSWSFNLLFHHHLVHHYFSVHHWFHQYLVSSLVSSLSCSLLLTLFHALHIGYRALGQGYIYIGSCSDCSLASISSYLPSLNPIPSPLAVDLCVTPGISTWDISCWQLSSPKNGVLSSLSSEHRSCWEHFGYGLRLRLFYM